MGLKTLPVLRDGDKLEGQACIVPGSLCYCDGCDCLRRVDERWTFKRVDSMPMAFCYRHIEQTTLDEPRLKPAQERLL